MFSVFHKKLQWIFKLETAAMLQMTDIIITVHMRIRNEQEDDYGTIMEFGYEAKMGILWITYKPVQNKTEMQVTYNTTIAF